MLEELWSQNGKTQIELLSGRHPVLFWRVLGIGNNGLEFLRILIISTKTMAILCVFLSHYLSTLYLLL